MSATFKMSTNSLEHEIDVLTRDNELLRVVNVRLTADLFLARCENKRLDHALDAVNQGLENLLAS